MGLLILVHFGSGPKCKARNKFYYHCLNVRPRIAKAVVADATLLLESVILGAQEWVEKGGGCEQRRAGEMPLPFLSVPDHCSASHRPVPTEIHGYLTITVHGRYVHIFQNIYPCHFVNGILKQT